MLTDTRVDAAKKVELMRIGIVHGPSAVIGIEHEQWPTNHLKYLIHRLSLYQGKLEFFRPFANRSASRATFISQGYPFVAHLQLARERMGLVPTKPNLAKRLLTANLSNDSVARNAKLLAYLLCGQTVLQKFCYFQDGILIPSKTHETSLLLKSMGRAGIGMRTLTINYV